MQVERDSATLSEKSSYKKDAKGLHPFACHLEAYFEQQGRGLL